MTPASGILAAACHLPEARQPLPELFDAAGVVLTDAVRARLGDAAVPVADGQTGSEMALMAAQAALDAAGVAASDVHVIIDYSVMPQEYLVPAWNMSNKLQHELGARRAFTLGLSGGHASQLLLALATADALIRTDPGVRTALLVGADLALPGNRILHPDAPVAVLGDAASAVVVQADAPTGRLLGTATWTDGAHHDTCFIPGGALAHPYPDLYRLVLDAPAFTEAPWPTTLRRLAEDVQATNAAPVTAALFPSLSTHDETAYRAAFEGVPALGADHSAGYLHGHTLVRRYLAAREATHPGDRLLAAAHGFGHLHAVTLIEH